MTNWRQNGYVPASDGEESDGELSTQVDTTGDVESDRQDENGGVQGASNVEGVVEGLDGQRVDSGLNQTATVQKEGGYEEDTTMDDIADDEYIDIDKTPEPKNDYPPLPLANVSNALEETEIMPDRPLRNERQISVVDLSNQPDESDDEDDMAHLMVNAHDLQEKEPTSLKGNQVIINNDFNPSSDPITGENRDLVPIFEQAVSTPLGPPVLDGSSSPLSSPPSSGEIIPPSSMPLPTTPRDINTGFEILVPIIQQDQLSPLQLPFSGSLRNLRHRKPIQLNPYLIEQERYRQTLKARGVQPVKITQTQDIDGQSTQNGDSQEADYVAPPDEESQHRRRRVDKDEMQQSEENGENGDFPDGVDLSKNRQIPSGALSGGGKRRKVSHTYSKHGRSVDPRNNGAGNLDHSSSAPKIVPTLHSGPSVETGDGMDIYDLPMSQSPTRRPLRHRSPNKPVQIPQEDPIHTIGKKQTGLLAVMDLSSDSEPPLTPEVAKSRLVSPVGAGPRLISISSSSSSSSSSPSSSESDDPSANIRKLQKRTNGVLPASWWKLDQKKDNELDDRRDSHRDRRGSSSIDELSRPGVARAKISSRPRTSDSIFNLISESDSSDDDPILIEPSVSASQGIRERDGPMRDWMDLDDDIIEDNRIDQMLPTNRRKRTTLPVKRKKRTEGNKSSNGIQGAGGSRGQSSGYIHTSGTTRHRQTKITNHTTSKKKPTRRRQKPSAPRLGIVDAVHHHRAVTNSSPPAFLKIANRRAAARKDQGRQSPSRKIFILESEMDTRDVQSVLREWREGTLSFGARNDGRGAINRTSDGANAVSHESRHSDRQIRFPSPQPLGDPSVQPLRTLGWDDSGVQRSLKPRVRQTTLSNIVMRQPVSRSLTVKSRPQKTVQARPFTILPGQRGVIAHRPAPRPQFAQFESEVPLTYNPHRLHQPYLRHQTPALVDLLRQKIPPLQKNSNLGRVRQDQSSARHSYARLNDSTVTQNARPASPNFPPEPSRLTKPKPRLRRKNTPRRIDADIIELRQPPRQDLVVREDDEPMIIQPDVANLFEDKPVLIGLAPYGNKYSLNFDTSPLKPGTIFNEGTFIGGGGFSCALSTAPARGPTFNRNISFSFGDIMFLQWGIYQDSVAGEFERAMGTIGDWIEKAQEKAPQEDANDHLLASQAYSFYAFFSKYLSEVLSFPDLVDLVSFGQRVLQAIESCCDRISTGFTGRGNQPNLRHASTRLALQTHIFSLLFAFQIYRLSSGDVGIQSRLDLEKSFRKLGHQLLGRLLKCGFGGIRACYEDQRQLSKHERGIGLEHYVVEIWVMAIQVLDQIGLDGMRFWQLFNLELRLGDIERTSDVRVLEKSWRVVYNLLPLFQFDHLGFAQRPLSEGGSSENWAMLKVLISRPLKIYNANAEEHSGTINDYCRILYARCHHLITRWGWINPEIIIPVLYEFFASNSLANLRNESDFGSADFVNKLETSPSLEVYDSDRCFHVLLKVVAAGLKVMKTTSTTRKIGGLVNRLMPNHRRSYPKEDELRVEHLTALRNHHDLLTTLYWAAPPNYRPPLDAIRLLVDPETSHRQACNVSVRSWSNLIRFQLHSEEGAEPLKPLMEWFDELTSHTLDQHNAARSEAEKQFKAAKDRGDIDISENQLEDNIRRNQKQLDGILTDAVHCLGTALSGLGGQIQNAMVILTKASTSNILNSYTRLSHKLILEVLNVLQQYMNICKAPESPQVVQPSEESQDYGDWSAFDDLVVENDGKQGAKHLVATVYDPLHRMLSNCFGADRQPEESLLVKIVDIWTLVAGFLVKHGLKTWNVYLDNYSRESWSSLRDTEQTRKFTAYFMPKIIQCGGDVYESNKITFISFWLKTLVERESMLKYQNEYTSTLFNYDPENPIFANPPFVRDELNGKFNISSADFRFRRLALIANVLANMRVSHDAALQESLHKAAGLKQTYSEMLKTMMKSMRENYEELQSKAVSGAYVEFIQQVVEYLLQHSVDIVPIDKFFTDSSAFPLPATDPTYVIGKLKNYGLKLSHPRAHKQLISFFQSVCERAAVDGEQEYLASQLTSALSGDFESGDPSKPTLRAFFLQAIFPAYIECAFSVSGGWIFAVPALKAIEKIIMNTRADIDSTLFGCLKSVMSMLTAFLDAIRISLDVLVKTPESISLPSTLGTLTLMIQCTAKTIPIIDWLSSEGGETISTLAETAHDSASFLIQFFGYAKEKINNREGPIRILPVDIRLGQRYQSPYEQPRKDCERSLQYTLTKELVLYGASWYVVRGASRRVVTPPVLQGDREGIETQKRIFESAVEELLKVASRTEILESVANSVDGRIWVYENHGKPYSGRARGRRKGRALAELGNIFW